MRFVSKLIVGLGLSTLLIAPNMIPAQAADYSHDIFPYVCDVGGDYANGDFSVGLVNDQGHFVLEVQSFVNNPTTYFCENAGGVAHLPHPAHLESISALIKTTGAFDPSDVFVEIFVNGDPSIYYFPATEARPGQTRGGYTQYTWTAKDLENLGFPRNATVSNFGFSINVYTIGAGFIRSPFFNTTRLPLATHLLQTCPFSNPNQCVK